MSIDVFSQLDRSFLDGLADGNLMIQTCRSCRKSWITRLETCPDCQTTELKWHASCCAGTLERAIALGDDTAFLDDPDATRAIGAVRLREGPMVSVRVAGTVPPIGTTVEIEVLGGSLIARAPAGL